MADDVKAVLDTLNIENAALVGFSMGGAISIRYMARHNGAHIKKLALLAAAAPCFTTHMVTTTMFSEKEVEYLKSQHLARISTVLPEDLQPQMDYQ
jgi:pimeloyl-ACP methyl ester carboxylesterase